MAFFKNAREGWKSSAGAPATRKLYKRGTLAIGGLFVFLIAFGGVRWIKLHHESQALETEAQLGPKVRVVPVAQSQDSARITLTGETRPYASTTLYAKVSGYLAEIRVDKGDEVKKNQALAIINSPETTKEYQAALADEQNKRGIANRMKELRQRNLVSQQEADQAFSDADISEAKLESIAVVKGYEVVRAPFAGVVTARFVDPGVLIQNAANSQSSSQPVVTVSQVNQLRVYVYVDQKYAFYVHKDDPVEVSLTERPDVKLKATVTRTAGDLDPRTRMMLVEVDLDNTTGQIVAGSFVQVTVEVKMAAMPQVPVDAVVLKDNKYYVVLVDEKGGIHYQEVSMGDNDGERVKILSGLKVGDTVALNLGNSVEDGGHVRAVASAPEEPKKKSP
jgi:membrane fusion protein, multidrug efflux system